MGFIFYRIVTNQSLLNSRRYASATTDSQMAVGSSIRVCRGAAGKDGILESEGILKTCSLIMETIVTVPHSMGVLLLPWCQRTSYSAPPKTRRAGLWSEVENKFFQSSVVSLSVPTQSVV